MRKVLLYSDCEFFAGCENMLAIFLNNKEHFTDYEFIFLYRYRKEYELGMKERIHDQSDTYSLNLWRFSYHKKGKINKIINIILNKLFSPIFFIQNFIVLYVNFHKHRSDICYINNGGYPGAFSSRVAVLASSLVKMKTIMFVNNISFSYTNPIRLLDLPLDLLVSKYVDIFITASKKAGTALKSVLNINNKKHRLIFNAIDQERFSIASKDLINLNKNNLTNKITFGVIGLHEERKGHILILKAAKKIIETNIDLINKFSVLIEGNGQKTKFLKSYASNNSLEKVVTFSGIEKDIKNFYKKIDILVVPSISNEDLPNVISEALLFGIPVIGSNLAGIPTQIDDDKNGYIFSIGDYNELSEKMSIFIKKPEIIKDMSLNCLEKFYKNFSVSSTLPQYNEIFNELMDDK